MIPARRMAQTLSFLLEGNPISLSTVQSRAQSVSGPRMGSAPIARTICYSLTTSVLVLCRGRGNFQVFYTMT
jgi:hypothetical protein